MTRLILTSSDSAGGCLLRAGIADVVIPFGFRFVWGPLPTDAELEAMLGRGALDHFSANRLGEFYVKGMGPLDLCERCETVELWFDPDPNAQLMLIQFLNHVSTRESVVSKLSLFQATVDIAEQRPEAISEWEPSGIEIRSEHLEAASMAWRAYRHPTPLLWADLLDSDTSVLPQLRQSVLELLEELPMPETGLSATEMQMLDLIGTITPLDVFFPSLWKRNARRVFKYWEIGELLDGLARCPTPAVAGLDEGPFTEELHADEVRYSRYKSSKLSLTPLGEAILAQADDFSRHNPIRRWWGGTKLTNDNLWRWDATNRALIAP